MTHPEKAQRRKAIADAVKGGMPRLEAAENFAVSDATVIMAMRENGVKVERLDANRVQARSDRLRKIADEVRKGKHPTHVAADMKIHPTVAYQACYRFGVRWKRKPYAGRLSRLKAGDVDWTQRDTDIAEKFHFTCERVRQIRRKLGKPQAVHHHRNRAFIRFLDWAKRQGNAIADMCYVDIARAYGKTSHVRVRALCVELGIGRTQTTEEKGMAPADGPTWKMRNVLFKRRTFTKFDAMDVCGIDANNAGIYLWKSLKKGQIAIVDKIGRRNVYAALK